MSIKLPENLENTIGLRLIVNEQGFNEMLSLPRAIVYVSVNWSGQERVSRSIVYKALNDFKISEIPIFKIDCSEQEKKYIEDWLGNQPSSLQDFYFNGYGETLLINYGQVVDYIRYPGQLGVEKTKLKIEHWLT